jgi:hypothetical protein
LKLHVINRGLTYPFFIKSSSNDLIIFKFVLIPSLNLNTIVLRNLIAIQSIENYFLKLRDFNFIFISIYNPECFIYWILRTYSIYLTFVYIYLFRTLNYLNYRFLHFYHLYVCFFKAIYFYFRFKIKFLIIFLLFILFLTLFLNIFNHFS